MLVNVKVTGGLSGSIHRCIRTVYTHLVILSLKYNLVVLGIYWKTNTVNDASIPQLELH